jgi:hypothetical protein
VNDLRLALRRVATSRLFRAVLAASVLAMHLYAVARMGRDRYELPFNSAPGQSVGFTSPAADLVPRNWDRLVVSRWDSQHYIDLFLRGLSQCPHPPDQVQGSDLLRCQLNFYPGYPAVGWLLSAGGRLPADYVLLALSLAASFVLLYAWTGPAMVEALGLRAAYGSLLAFNTFTSAYTLVTILTEPCLLACAMVAAICLQRRRYLAGALLAGAATALRVSGPAVGAAYGLALLAATWRSPPRGAAAWTRRVLEGLACVWGMVALMVYFWVRLRDPLAYFHAHATSYSHEASLSAVLWPAPEYLKRGLADPQHPALFAFGALVWFSLGHRDALRGFPAEVQVFWYAEFALVWLISVAGTITLGLPGNSRYMLAVLPMFFAIGALTRRRPAALLLWVGISAWFYWQVDLCHYVGNVGATRFTKCHDEVLMGGGF